MGTRIQLPDLLTKCPFELRLSPYCRRISLASDEWLGRGANLSNKEQLAIAGLKAGLLASMCFPTVDLGQFRVCCDFINLFFYIKSSADSIDMEGMLALTDVVLNTIHHPEYQSDVYLAGLVRDVWSRFQKTCPISVQQRLVESIKDMFQAVEQEVHNRISGMIPDFESFISLRRDASPCRPAFILIEYAHGMRLPREVYSDPNIWNITRFALDLVCWSNDILAYNFDQSRYSSHNIVTNIMHTKGMSLQNAINHIASLYRSTLELFVHQLRDIPSWGDKIDAEVETYVRGLQDWIIGTLHWSFETERYFGDQGESVRSRRRITQNPPGNQ